jgi:hypothetical protein
MSDRFKAAIALALCVGFFSWLGWFRPWNWTSWVAPVAAAGLVAFYSWVLKEFDGTRIQR